MIEYVKGSLLEAKEQYIVHQCNCYTVAAGGLAYHLFNKFPYANCYKNRMKADKPGTINIAGDGGKDRFVINLFGQYNPGKATNNSKSIDSTEQRLVWFKECLNTISKIDGLKSIAFPHLIGCGLAGGNWDDYLMAIEDFELIVATKHEVSIVAIYEKPLPFGR